MKLIISTLVLCMVMSFAAVSAQAAALVLKGKGGEIVTLESAPDIGKDAYLVKIDGANSPWDGKVFAVTKQVVSDSDRYGFDHKVELSSGVQTSSYNMLVETDGTLSGGTIADTYALYFPGSEENGLELAQDAALSDAYVKGSLAEAYKASPYTPVVD